MDKKKRNIQITCYIVGTVALWIDLLLSAAGSNTVLFALRILFTGIAAITYAIKMGVEISNNDDSFYVGHSIFLIVLCLFEIGFTALQL